MNLAAILKALGIKIPVTEIEAGWQQIKRDAPAAFELIKTFDARLAALEAMCAEMLGMLREVQYSAIRNSPDIVPGPGTIYKDFGVFDEGSYIRETEGVARDPRVSPPVVPPMAPSAARTVVPCSKCGEDMEIPEGWLSAYRDIGLQCSKCSNGSMARHVERSPSYAGDHAPFISHGG